MKIILWNTQWAAPGSERERMIREIVLGSSPDLVCITEGYRQTWEDHGHLICSQADYGYPLKRGRRKVLLLSRTPWSEIDDLGHAGLPPGRFVSGVTQGIRCFGVCVPWKDAHVRNGRKDRLQWEDHISYLDGLSEVLHRHHGSQSILLGDFNQRIPRRRQPVHVFEKLEAVLGKGFIVHTRPPLVVAPSRARNWVPPTVSPPGFLNGSWPSRRCNLAAEWAFPESGLFFGGGRGEGDEVLPTFEEGGADAGDLGDLIEGLEGAGGDEAGGEGGSDAGEGIEFGGSGLVEIDGGGRGAVEMGLEFLAFGAFCGSLSGDGFGVGIAPDAAAGEHGGDFEVAELSGVFGGGGAIGHAATDSMNAGQSGRNEFGGEIFSRGGGNSGVDARKFGASGGGGEGGVESERLAEHLGDKVAGGDAMVEEEGSGRNAEVAGLFKDPFFVGVGEGGGFGGIDEVEADDMDFRGALVVEADLKAVAVLEFLFDELGVGKGLPWVLGEGGGGKRREKQKGEAGD